MLWSLCVKTKAGFKSEYSGKAGRQIGGEAILNAHHLLGKPNFALRYSLDSGICLTNGEHNFTAHSTSRSYLITDFVGEERMNRLKALKQVTMKADYKMKEIELTELLKTL